MNNLNKVLQRPTPNISLPRNGFDRGYEIKYNFSSGQLLPVFAEPVFGGSKCVVNRQELLRCSQVNTASMARVDHHVDFYFVPFRLMYSNYGQARPNVADVNSSLLGSKDFKPNLYIPSITGGNLQDYLLAQTGEKDIFGYDVAKESLRLLDLLNYGITSSLMSNNLEAVNLPNQNPFRILAYQKVYYDQTY